MPLNSIHVHSHLIISISVLILTVSSRPITTNTVILTTSSGQKFEVRLHVALQSETIKQMIIDGGGFFDETILSFPNITGETMAKVLEYCDKHVYDHDAGSNITAVDEMREFDAQFVDVHYETLFDLFRAANELKIKKLSDVVGGRIGHMMLGKSVQEIRIIFNINDSCVDHHPPQEEEELNAWEFH